MKPVFIIKYKRVLTSSLIFLLILLIFEINIRLSLFYNQGFYKGIFGNPGNFFNQFQDDNYWKLHFKKFFLKSKSWRIQKLLGWINHKINFNTLKILIEPLQDKRVILFYGDSFAECSVKPCFEDFINAGRAVSKEFFLLNYGNGGYGLDQIMLLFENSWKFYKNPFVIISFLTEDMDRSTFRIFQLPKPFFEIIDSKLILKGVPLDPDGHKFIKKFFPEPDFYTWSFFINLVYKNSMLKFFYDFKKKRETEFREKVILLSEKILARLIKNLNENRLEFFFLIFTPPYNFPDENGNYKYDDWRLDFLKTYLISKKVNFILSKDIILADARKNNFKISKYFNSFDEHLSVYSNKLISEEIIKKIQ